MINLKGKTIEKISQVSFSDYPDDHGFLLIEFTDKTKILIQSDYGGYDISNKCNDEYPTDIYVFPFKEETKFNYLNDKTIIKIPIES